MKNAQTTDVRHLSISIAGTIQPDRMGLITGGADDGLAARFLWCWPEPPPFVRLAREASDHTQAKYAFSRLADLQMGSDTFGKAEALYVPLDEAAFETLDQFTGQMAARAEDAAGAFAGALGKSRGLAMRLSLILTYAWWCATPGRPEPSAIRAEAMTAACASSGDEHHRCFVGPEFAAHKCLAAHRKLRDRTTCDRPAALGA